MGGISEQTRRGGSLPRNKGPGEVADVESGNMRWFEKAHFSDHIYLKFSRAAGARVEQ